MKEQTAAATTAVSSLAAAWEPYVVAALLLALFLLIGDAVLQPIVWSFTSDGWYPIEKALIHIRDNVLAGAPGYALLWTFWEARVYLSRLRQGDMWLSSTQKLLSRIGWTLVLAGFLGMAVRPAFRFLHEGDISLSSDLSWGTLAGVGLLVIMIGRIAASIVEAAAAVKRENEDFV